MSALWVFVSAGASVGANICSAACQPEVVASMPAGGSMRRMAVAAMACPPPTLVIQVSLATGFGAAVTTGLSLVPSGSSGSGPRESLTLVDAKSSGGHFNPAVSLSLAARRFMTPMRLLTYISAQLVGAVVGAALWMGIVSKECYSSAFTHGTVLIEPLGSQILLHCMLTLTIALVHLWAHERLMSMATPILIGFTYVAITLVGSQMLGGEVPNMLRTFGLSVVGIGSWHRFPAVAIGSACGGLAAALLDVLLFGRRLWHGPVSSSPRHEAERGDDGRMPDVEGDNSSDASSCD